MVNLRHQGVSNGSAWGSVAGDSASVGRGDRFVRAVERERLADFEVALVAAVGVGSFTRERTNRPESGLN
jgi:hypothetical protein